MSTISAATRLAVRPSEGWARNLSILVLIGAAVALIGIFAAPDRAWPNVLLSTYYLISLGLAGGLFVALQYVSNAGWSVSFRRIPEAMTEVLPVTGLLLVVLFLGIHTLYEWSHEAVVANDPILHSKSGWLNEPFFIARSVFYLAVWMVMITAIVKRSQRQDASGDLELTRTNRKISAGFLVVFALTFTLASMDWIMSLEPHWFSTIFGIYNFAGLFLNGLATMTLVIILLKRMGPFRNVINDSHLHDLGKLIFAFSTFWMYIWFSQYVLIWYANIPEEVTYYARREEGGWGVLTIVNILFNWVIPFIALLPIWTKRHEGVLLRVCIFLMIGHWIDLFWMIMPPFMAKDPIVGLWELGPILAALAAFFLIVFKSLAKGNLLPVGDPMLGESLNLHT
ncbi:MAG: hypothetical protein HYZ01_00395 [Ignavibacteriales bacterium]|nr:hypothetical protein [Ignavibacteriales bacterium]